MFDKSKAIAYAAIAGAVLGVAALTPTAMAADQTVDINAGSSASLDEIVVTAAKFNEDVMHAPVAVTAINGDDLVRLHINNWTDLQSVVPGLAVETGGGGTTFNIRGVGDAFNNPNIAQGVPVYRDGLLVPLGIGDEALWDIGNVQVLRGPQGTLTGANSVGGAIFISEVGPSLNDTSGYFQIVGAQYHNMQAQGAVTLPISDTLAARVGAYVDKRDSFSKDETPQVFRMANGMPQWAAYTTPGSMNQYALRGSLLYQPSTRLSVLARIDFMTNDTGGQAQKPFHISTTVDGSGNTLACPAAGSFFGTSPSTWSQVLGNCGFSAFAPADPYTIAYAGRDTTSKEQMWREHVEAKYQFWDDGLTLKLLAGAQYNTNNNSSENTGSTYYNGGSINGSHEHTLTYEADLISPSNQPLQWVVGGFWWRDANGFVFTNPGANGGALCTSTNPADGCSTPNGGGIYLFGANAKTNYALFSNLQYQFNDQWKVEGGVRETWDVNSNPTIPCPAGTPIGPTCQSGGSGPNLNSFHFFTQANPNDPYTYVLASGPGSGFSNWGEQGDHLFTWKLAVDYSLTANNFLYAQVATGAKAGGIQNQGDTPDCHGGVAPPHNACFQPEKDTNIEVGYKATMLDGHATLQTDAFYIKYNNMQVNSRDPYTGQGNIHNAGSAHDQGLELSAQVDEAGWLVAGNASYTKSSVSIGNIVDDEVCGLVAACQNANNIGQCAAGQPNGGANASGTSTKNCFNYVGGVTLNGQFLPFVESVSGLQLPNSPKFQGNASVSYRVPLGDDALTPRLDYMYQGKQYDNLFNTPFDQLASRSNVNASLTWNHARWAVEAYVTNLSNEVYVVTGGDPQSYNAPRQFGVQVNWTSK